MSVCFDVTVRTAAVRAAMVACLVASCGQGNHASGPAPHEEGKEAPPMTTMDPSSSEAWKQAEAIAATQASGALKMRSKALPFLFMADRPAAVLVHKGVVVKEKGAAAAGSYLRDLGVIQGKGPAIEDVLYVLHVLDAWPSIKEVDQQAYIHYPNDERLADLTARLEYDGESARVVLHYFLSEGARPSPVEPSQKDYKKNDVGTVDKQARPPATRQVARATLVIPASGEPAWKPIEKLNWADPAP
jgi:hypothetical protein